MKLIGRSMPQFHQQQLSTYLIFLIYVIIYPILSTYILAICHLIPTLPEQRTKMLLLIFSLLWSRPAVWLTKSESCSGLMCAIKLSYCIILSLLFLKGGPGCSSFDGLMMELGPWRIDGNGGLKTVQGGWEEYTTMVFGENIFQYMLFMNNI